LLRIGWRSSHESEREDYLADHWFATPL